MTTPIPVTAPTKSYNIVAPDRNMGAGRVTETMNLVDESTNQLVDESGNLLVAGTVTSYTALHIAAEKKSYIIIAPERNND